MQASADEIYFWATHAGAELDLLLVRGRQRLGFEFKRSSSPGLTASMRSALADLKLSRLYVIHAGTERYVLGTHVEAVPLADATRVLQARPRSRPRRPMT